MQSLLCWEANKHRDVFTSQQEQESLDQEEARIIEKQRVGRNCHIAQEREEFLKRREAREKTVKLDIPYQSHVRPSSCGWWQRCFDSSVSVSLLLFNQTMQQIHSSAERQPETESPSFLVDIHGSPLTIPIQSYIISTHAPMP